ncbi:MAG: hypothetical protein EHM12_01640, partial [Dehalococcoidia bacterium]
MISLTRPADMAGKNKHAKSIVKNGKSRGVSYDSLDIMPLPVIVVDREYNVIYTNAKGAAIAGCDRELCIGRKCHEVYKTKLCNTPDCQTCKALADGNAHSMQAAVNTSTGAGFYRCCSSPIRDDAGTITGAIEYFVDAGNELNFAAEVGKTFDAIYLGQWDTRVNHSQLDGVLQGIGQRTNDIVDMLIKVINDEQLYFAKIAAGDMDLLHLEKTGNDQWDKAIEEYNNSADTLQNVRTELDKLNKAAIEGH